VVEPVLGDHWRIASTSGAFRVAIFPVQANGTPQDLRMRTAVLALVVTAGCTAFPQAPASVSAEQIDIAARMLSYDGVRPGRPRPQLGVLKNPVNNAVVNGCLDGASLADLGRQIPDLAERIESLVAARLITVRNDRCSPAFPAVVGSRRAELARAVAETAIRLGPRVNRILNDLRQGLGFRQDLVFHALWSRVIDASWVESWRQAFPRMPGPPGVAWIVAPAHRLQVGTNYETLPGGGGIAVTWSRFRSDHIRSVMDARLDLVRLAWQEPASAPGLQILQRLGCATEDGKLRVFAFPGNGAQQQLFDRLIKDYAGLLETAFDYRQLGEALNVRSDEVFVIALHELAWELLARLSEAGRLQVPAALSDPGNAAGVVELVSLRLNRKPGSGTIEEQANEIMGESGWRGTAESVRKLKELLAGNPGNPAALMYLGLSLYDLHDYRAALDAFSRLSLSAPATDFRHPWSHIWGGHMYDLIGEREAAVKQYEQALGATEEAQFAQYHIGPVSADGWARERLEKPFDRR
jgi:tetratricopeptide (TPR) repeat protein